MKIIIACGGSGGHIFPGIALAYELKDRGNDILMVCSRRPLDIEILKKSALEFKAIPAKGLIGTLSPIGLLLLIKESVIGVAVTLKLLSGLRPHCVVGFGGFLSGPVIFAAWLRRVPIIIHEQNLVAGLANRIESLFADKIAVSFEGTKNFFNRDKVIKVGNPVRKRFVDLDKVRSRERFGLDRDRFTLFVIGGSQGASAINIAMVEALSIMDHEEKKAIQVIHISGEKDYEFVKDGYMKGSVKSKVFSFLDEVERAYSASDLIIARAGATTIAEVTYFGKPAILIPYPKKKVHQIENAYFLSDNKAAIIIEENGLSKEALKETISRLQKDSRKLEEMSKNSKRLAVPDASSLLAEEVTSLTGAT